MLVDITKFGRVDGQRGRELVYIEFLATAPWNRPGFVPDATIQGCRPGTARDCDQFEH